MDASKLRLLKGVLDQTCREFIFDVVNDGSGSGDGNENENDAAAIEATKTFMKNRQITFFGGWWGMLCQALRIETSETNAIFRYKHGIMNTSKGVEVSEMIPTDEQEQEPRSPVTRSRAKKMVKKL
mgnify:CR=1 FL=1